MRGIPPQPPRPPLPLPLVGPTPGLPVGSIVAFAGEALGSSQDRFDVETSGWMVCDGRELPTSSFPELFALIRYRYSPQSGGGTFHLPDLRGYFLRGVDGGSGNDPDAGSRRTVGGRTSSEVGSLQDCALQLHEHTYSQPSAPAPVQAQGEPGTTSFQSAQTSGVVREDEDHVLHTSPAETRPRNVAVYFLIKFTGSPMPWEAPLRP